MKAKILCGKIDFITVSLDFAEELNTGVPQFLGEMKAEMPTYLLTSADENALIPSIAKNWTGALPFTILYNEKGEIIYSRPGKISKETLKGEIEKTLSQKNEANETAPFSHSPAPSPAKRRTAQISRNRDVTPISFPLPRIAILQAGLLFSEAPLSS